MAINLNADVGQILKGLMDKKKSGGGKGKGPSVASIHYKQAATKCVMIACIALCLGWGINFLSNSSVQRDETEFATLEDLEAAVVKIEQDIASSRVLLDNNRKKVEEFLPMFSDIEGSKGLFKLISDVAEKNSLIIRNLSQGDTVESATPATHLQTRIMLELEGYYPNYMRFKKELSLKKPILKIDSEAVKLKIGPNGERRIGVSLSFMDYAVEKQEYEKALEK